MQEKALKILKSNLVANVIYIAILPVSVPRNEFPCRKQRIFMCLFARGPSFLRV